MYGDLDWTTDVLPQLQAFLQQSIVQGGMIALIAIAVGVYAARGLISVFFKRD